jgi:hypothetical protein
MNADKNALVPPSRSLGSGTAGRRPVDRDNGRNDGGTHVSKPHREKGTAAPQSGTPSGTDARQGRPAGTSETGVERDDQRARSKPSHLCSQCGLHPCLGTLSRCGGCIKAAADADRATRSAAETRVGAKAARQAALEKLGDAFLEFAASPEGLSFLEGQHAELTAPRVNDPNRIRDLEAREADRSASANETAVIHHHIIGGRSKYEIELINPRDTAAAVEGAERLGRHLEAPVRRHEDTHDATRFADRTQKTPPKHSFGREKRSLSNRGRDR